VACRYKKPLETRILSERILSDLGWMKTQPQGELLNKIEQARVSEERTGVDKKAVAEWVKKWTGENLSKEEQKVFGRFAQQRLTQGKSATPWDVIEKLATIKDKEFASAEDMDKWFAESGIAGDLVVAVKKRIPTTVDLVDDMVVCLNASDGKTLWKTKYPGKVQDWGSSGTPCVVAGRCYVGGTDGVMYCLNTEDGKEIWKTKSGGGARNSSPVVVGDAAVLFADALTAFDINTGRILWTQNDLKAEANSPAVWQKDGKTYLICNSSKQTACVNPPDGTVLWKVPGGGNSTAAISGDWMVVNTDKLTAYKMTLEKAEKLWETEFKDRASCPIIFEGNVYCVLQGRACCMNLETGKTAWNEAVKVQEIPSPILADRKILAYGDEGVMMIAATPEKYTPLGVLKCSVPRCVSPTIADGKVFVRMKDCVACYDFRKTQ
jgi:outer membrane protein assembly factor BamB